MQKPPIYHIPNKMPNKSTVKAIQLEGAMRVLFSYISIGYVQGFLPLQYTKQ